MGGGGGKSSSSTATTTTTQNTDKRMVLDGQSLGVAADGGSSVSASAYITNNTLDGGAIKGAGEVALSAIASNATNFDHLIAASQTLFKQQQNSLDANVKLTGDLAATAKTAYADAANQASGNKQLILASMAVVAVVAFGSFKR